MPAQKGSSLIVKVGNGGMPETFSTIGGMTLTRLRVENRQIAGSDVASGRWRKLLDRAGISNLMIACEGVFSDLASEETLRGYAFASSVNQYQLGFGNGDSLSGPFLIAQYERSGDYDAEERYALTLESAGDILFTVAP
jgi:predicted secreted protein